MGLRNLEEAADRFDIRRLLACFDCHAQYDVSGRKPGTPFHCNCGTLLTVPSGLGHSAAVVRCSSCGAPRSASEEACNFCKAEFTLHERDLHTLCPGCFSRISDRARFCHHCGLAISAQPAGGGEATAHPCPVCPEHFLFHRSLGESQVTVLECPRCGGLWMGHEAFQHLRDKAFSLSSEWNRDRSGDRPMPGKAGALYRRCIHCGRLMARRNFERRSGVIVDICPKDGIWFDLGEVERILAWIQQGGPQKAWRRDNERRRAQAFDHQIRKAVDPLERVSDREFAGSNSTPPLLKGLLDFLTRD